MAASPESLPLSTPRPPREKLLVVRFLDEHLAQGCIQRPSYDVLHRIVLMISAIGVEVHRTSQSGIAHASVIRRIEWHAECVLEGCEAFCKQAERRVNQAERAAQQLPDLGAISDEDLDRELRNWRATLRWGI